MVDSLVNSVDFEFLAAVVRVCLGDLLVFGGVYYWLCVLLELLAV